LLPANLFIYGVNDYFDYETDKNNPKKKEYETLITPKNRKFFIKVFSLLTLPFITLLSFIFVQSSNSTAFLALLLFLFFGAGYSAPPIRAKTKPFLDSFFNILYIFPGLISYGIMTNDWPPLSIIIAATAWCMAMHAFSAIPDIESDKKAKLSTVATVLGRNRTIIFCSLLYGTSAVLVYPYLGYFAVIGGIAYLIMMLAAYLTRSKEDLFAVYKKFPLLNMVIGAYLFFAVIVS
jgi:4-hydroxybenzoate polyprenyltransferase